MPHVIRKRETGELLMPPGSEHSTTPRMTDAQIFETEAIAEATAGRDDLVCFIDDIPKADFWC
jgi:hypothetical protein